MNPEYFFSISEGGFFHKALMKMRLYNHPSKLIVVFLSITWLPLFIITAFEGTLYSGTQMPFLNDVAMQTRLLVTLPLLLILRLIIDSKVRDLQKYFSETLMNDDKQQLDFGKVLRRARKLANSSFMELILLLIVIAVTVNVGKGGLWNEFHVGNMTWKETLNGGDLVNSFAGKWAGFISVPVFQFLLLRWLWRYMIWLYFLFCLSRNRLNLQPTHPDRSGGLGIVFQIQKYISLLFVAICTVVSGELVAQLIKDPGSFQAIRDEAIGYIVICLILLIIPLFFFSIKLLKTKHQGLLQLSNLGANLSGKFEKEWISEHSIEEKVTGSIVSTSTIQDYSTVYKSLQQLQPVPVSIKDFFVITFLLIIPFLPVLFIHFSFGELLQKLLGLVL